MTHLFRRRELYDLIWNEPRTALAKRLGISDVGLGKACTKARIPMPPRGYWARKAAGKSTIDLRLPPRSFGQSDFVQVGSPDYHPTTNEDALRLPPEPVFDEPVESVKERATAMLVRCKVPRGLQRPHPLISVLLEEDEARRKALEVDRHAWRKPEFDDPQAQRRIRVANALFMVMAHAGCAASATRKDLLELAFRVGDVCITIKVTFRQVTPKTQTKTGGRDRDVLTLTASGWPRISGINTEWSDGGAGRIEDQVLAIARDLLVIGELTYREWEKEQYAWQTRRKNEVEQMAREAQERREREETARMLWEETQRRDWLFQQAVDLRRADEIRALVRAQDAIRSVPDERRLDEIYEQWRAWALHEADELDPRLRPLNELVTPPDRGGSQT